MFDVYITKTAKYLPNDPISNEEMEDYLGYINDRASKAKNIVLRNNGIKTRYFALDKQGLPTHNNAELTYMAISQLYDKNFTKHKLELLSCGTSTPDVFLPSHAAMVHGLMDNRPVELNSSTGVCCSGMNALKFGFLSVKSGSTQNAVCTGSERVSSWLVANKFDPEASFLERLENSPIVGLNKEFLRWMLSDGAGAFLLQNHVAKEGISLKINWMDAYSFAHEIETCMYAGGEKNEDGSIISWSDLTPEEWSNQSIFAIKQDIKVLDKHITLKGAESLANTIQKHQINVDEIDYFLPHVSSQFFVQKLYDSMAERGIHIPLEKWFLNLDRVGNVGSASIYLSLDELVTSGTLKPGNKILLAVPESGRFSYAYAYLTVH